MKKIFAPIYCCLLFAYVLSADELPPPFVSYETTSTADGNGTAYTWNVQETGVSGNIYAGRVMLSSLSSSLSFIFDGASGTLKFKCTNYAGGAGCLVPSWFCAWLTDDEFISNWYGTLNGSSYKENSLTCYFPAAGRHKVTFSISMQKQASKYYVQGPRMVISNIEWQPDYVDTNVDGNSVRIDGKWIRDNVSTNILYGCKYDYNEVLKTVGENSCTILDSYIAGLSPTNLNSKLVADIHMTNDAAVITWTPHLDNRIYTIYGKTNLADKVWHSPTNESSRLFRVEVSLPLKNQFGQQR